MPDPVNFTAAAAGKWMGLNFLTLIAGFAGGVISLSFIKNLTRMQGALAVLTGLCVAAFLAPLPAPWTAHALAEFAGTSSIGEWQNKIEAAYGFLFGITGMTLVPGFMAMARKFQDDPLFLLRLLIGKGKR